MKTKTYLAWALCALICFSSSLFAATNQANTAASTTVNVTLRVADQNSLAFVHGATHRPLMTFVATNDGSVPATFNQMDFVPSGSITYLFVEDQYHVNHFAKPVLNSNVVSMQNPITVPPNSSISIVVRGDISDSPDFPIAFVDMVNIVPTVATNVYSPSSPVHFIVDKVSAPSITNVSHLVQVAPGGSSVLDFNISGEPSDYFRVLVRVVGPSLATFGITNPMKDISMALKWNGLPILNSDYQGWNSGAEANQMIKTAGAQGGAFPLVDGNKDAALVTKVNPGLIAVTITDNTKQGGTILVEIYALPL